MRYACADPSRVPPVVTDQADADAQAPGGRHWAGDRLRSSRRAVARELPPATRSGESRTTNVEYDPVAIDTEAEIGNGPDSDPLDQARPRVTRSGHSLRCSHGVWANAPTGFSYLWVSGGRRIGVLPGGSVPAGGYQRRRCRI